MPFSNCSSQGFYTILDRLKSASAATARQSLDVHVVERVCRLLPFSWPPRLSASDITASAGLFSARRLLFPTIIVVEF